MKTTEEVGREAGWPRFKEFALDVLAYSVLAAAVVVVAAAVGFGSVDSGSVLASTGMLLLITLVSWAIARVTT